MNYFAKRSTFHSIMPHPLPLIIQPLFLLVSKVPRDSEQVVRDFNQGLERIRKNGTFDAIMKASGLL